MTSSLNPAEENISEIDVQHDFAALLARVRKGRRYVVTAEGRPVARLAPYDDAADEAEGRAAARAALISRLDSQPAVTPGVTWTREELYDR